MIQLNYRPDTVQGTLARAVVRLATSSESPRADAQLLLAHAMNRDTAWLVKNAQTYVSKTHFEKYAALIEKRCTGMPVAYVIGTWGFYAREFEVTPDVLIPRPETEHLVEAAVAYLNGRAKRNSTTKQLFTVLDVGVGSGAIACSIAAEVAYAVVEGTDINEKAVKLAARNARRLNVQARCKFHHGDLVEPVEGKTYDCIIANLPYVPSNEVPLPPDPVGHEPVSALDGGPDGLALYRRLIPRLEPLLRPDALVLLEAAPRTIDGLRDLAAEHFPKAEVCIVRDYAGLDRYVSVRLSPNRPAG